MASRKKSLEAILHSHVIDEMALQHSVTFHQPVLNWASIANGNAYVQANDRRTFYDFFTGKRTFKLPCTVNASIKYVGGKYLVSSGLGESVTFYDAQTGKEEFTAHQGESRLLTELDGRVLYMFRSYKTKDVIFFDAKTGEKVLTLPESIDERVYNINGRKLVASSTAVQNLAGERFYDLSTGQIAFTLPQRVSWVGKIDDIILMKGIDGKTFYDARTLKVALTLPENIENIFMTADNVPAGLHVSEGQTVVYALKTGEPLTEMPYEIAPPIIRINGKVFANIIDTADFCDMKSGAMSFTLPLSRLAKELSVDELVLPMGNRTFVQAKNERTFYELTLRKVVHVPLEKLPHLLA